MKPTVYLETTVIGYLAMRVSSILRVAANQPSLRPRIERLCREMGYELPVICTPQELLEIDDGT